MKKDGIIVEAVQIKNISVALTISNHVPVMAAPDLAQELLIQYISELSNTKGFTTLEIWREKVHKIGVRVSALNGFYREYNNSLVCLSELQMNRNPEQLKEEFF